MFGKTAVRFNIFSKLAKVFAAPPQADGPLVWDHDKWGAVAGNYQVTRRGLIRLGYTVWLKPHGYLRGPNGRPLRFPTCEAAREAAEADHARRQG